jgi:hypothetical protein
MATDLVKSLLKAENSRKINGIARQKRVMMRAMMNS